MLKLPRVLNVPRVPNMLNGASAPPHVRSVPRVGGVLPAPNVQNAGTARHALNALNVATVPHALNVQNAATAPTVPSARSLSSPIPKTCPSVRAGRKSRARLRAIRS